MNTLARTLLASTLTIGVAVAGGSVYAADLAMPHAAPVTIAPAADGLYVSIFGGGALAATLAGPLTGNSVGERALPTKLGYAVGGTIGIYLMPNLRGEAELSYVHHDIMSPGQATGTGSFADSGSVGTVYLLGNLWYDFDLGGGFTPYAGAGLGLAIVQPQVNAFIPSTATWITSATAPAAQFGVGVKVRLADNVGLDLGYRYKHVFNATLKSEITKWSFVSSSDDQTIQAGLTFGF